MSRNLEDEASFFLGEGRNAEVMATDVDRVDDVEGNPESDFALYGSSNLNRTDQGGLMKFLGGIFAEGRGLIGSDSSILGFGEWLKVFQLGIVQLVRCMDFL